MRWLAAVLAIFAVSAIIVNGQEKSSKTAPSQHPAENVHKPEAPAPAIVPIKQEESEIQKNSAKDHANNYLSRLFSAENLPNILLFFAGIGGIGVAVSTLKAIRRQADIMERQIAQAAEGGKQTDQIIETMSDNAVRELRAYVCLSHAKIEFRQERAPEMQVYMKNFGKTPAYDVRWWIHTWIGPYPLQEKLPEPPSDFQTAVSTLAPGGDPHIMVTRRTPPIQGGVMHLIGTAQGTIYVYGKLTYRDCFGNPQFTNFRLLHGGSEPIYPRSKDGMTVALLKPDREGNEAS